MRIDQWLEAVFHGLQAGRPLYLNPEEPERSGFIALTYNDVANTKSIQGVLADKCVILVDEPDSGFIFDRLSLSHFYPTKSKVIIRGIILTSPSNLFSLNYMAQIIHIFQLNVLSAL